MKIMQNEKNMGKMGDASRDNVPKKFKSPNSQQRLKVCFPILFTRLTIQKFMTHNYSSLNFTGDGIGSQVVEPLVRN